MEMCARCKKRPATVYIMKLENGEQKQEGLCLVCAKELGIKPVNDIMKKMGISDEELEIVKWGRNAKGAKTKHADIVTYRLATGLEALIGKLYFDNKFDRIEVIMNFILGE